MKQTLLSFIFALLACSVAHAGAIPSGAREDDRARPTDLPVASPSPSSLQGCRSHEMMTADHADAIVQPSDSHSPTTVRTFGQPQSTASARNSTPSHHISEVEKKDPDERGSAIWGILSFFYGLMSVFVVTIAFFAIGLFFTYFFIAAGQALLAILFALLGLRKRRLRRGRGLAVAGLVMGTTALLVPWAIILVVILASI